MVSDTPAPDPARTAPTQPQVFRLNSAATMPLQGFGLYKVPASSAEELTRDAIAAGYRLIDTAAFYGNEEAVGAGIRGAIADGIVQRHELFVTSKLWNDQHGYESALRGFEDSLARLGLDYLDLFLIHWPCPAQDKYLATWQAFEKIAQSGGARSIGVSNFLTEHLTRLLAASDTVPAVNQVELHPWLQQSELRAFHAQHSIATQAWSPLARGKALGDPELQRLAELHGVSVAQLILSWLKSLAISAIPKASSPERISENFAVSAKPLSEQLLAEIASVDRGERVGSDPRTVS